MSNMSVGKDMWWILTLFSMNKSVCFGDVCALSAKFKDSHHSHISAVPQVELT